MSLTSIEPKIEINCIHGERKKCEVNRGREREGEINRYREIERESNGEK